jgi:hypothetical protein
MIDRCTSADQLLYHYTKASTVMSRILENRLLQFGSYAQTNDPKESNAWRFTVATNEDKDLGGYETEELSIWLSKELKDRTKLACFSTDTGPLSGDHMKDIFNRGFCKPRMWANYAEKHTGVCLVFERERIRKLIEKQFSSYIVLNDYVRYVNRCVTPDFSQQQYTINVDYLESVGREVYVRSHLRTYYRQLFFEKMMDWRDESEYRWVIFSDSADSLSLDIEDCLVGIIFGENTKEDDIEQVMAMTALWGLDYMGLKWGNCSPWYDYGNHRYVPGLRSISFTKRSVS